MDFKNKVAVVTGGTQGIGKAVCLKLASLGANIVVNGIGSIEQAEAVKKECEAYGVQAIAVIADISSFNEAKHLMDEAVKAFGRIDILVNNAGITRDQLILRMKESHFDDVIRVNLKGCWNCMKHVSRIMTKQRYGKIISMASVVGVQGNAGQINYAASKAGIIGMTKSLAKELASRGINVNAVAPGFVDTQMTEVLDEKIKEQILAHIPFHKMASPEDIANVVAFLASDLSSYMTGQTLNVDGGMVM